MTSTFLMFSVGYGGRLRLLALVVAVAAVFAGGVVPPSPAVALTVAADCRSTEDVSTCDADGDRIADTVEREVCGTMTCATGTEDTDGDGIPDWTEVLSCDDSICASATSDVDEDGIPDFAERLVCENDTCSNSTEDADGDGIGDWIEFVICGDRTCADGSEDYNGNGVSDADELAACVVRVDDLATTGWLLGGLVALAAALLGIGIIARLRRSRRSDEEGEETGPPDLGGEREPVGVAPSGGAA